LAQTSPAPKAPVDQLIPWLLDENQQLRGVPFSELIFDTTGRKVLSFEAKNTVDQRVAKAISAACDETMKRLNAPDSVIQNIDRINEVSSHFEDTLRELLSGSPGLKVRFPAHSRGQNPTFRLSGFAHHRPGEQTRVLFGPKALRRRKPRQQFPHVLFRAEKIDEQVREDAVHFVVGFEHAPRETASGSPKATWNFTRWDLVDLSRFRVKLKADFREATATCTGRRQLSLQREVILIRAVARARVRVAEHLAGGNGIMLNDLTGEGNISVRRD